MPARPLVLLIVVAAVLLCVILVLRVLDQEAPTDAPEPVPAATGRPAAPLVQPAPTAPAPATSRPPAETAPPTERWTALRAAEEALEILDRLLHDSSTTNDDIIRAMDRVLEFYVRPPQPDDTPDAGPTNKDLIAAALLARPEQARFAADHGWTEAYLRRVLSWRTDAEKHFVRALKLVKSDSGEGPNLRESVNVRAAQTIGDTGNPQLAADVIKVLERTVFQARYEISAGLLDAAFGTVGRLGDPESLEWLVKEFTHAKSNPPVEVDRLVAAHAALLRFDPKRVKGEMRYEIAREFVRTYAGVEALASARDPNAEPFWERIGPGVIRVLQHYAGAPKDENDRPLDTVAAFQEWFRDHKNPRRPPWGE